MTAGADPGAPDERAVFRDTLHALLDNTPNALEDLYGAEESVRQIYSDRFVFELLQNARDAAARPRNAGVESGRLRALLLLTENALIVANDGEPFTFLGYEALTGIAQDRPRDGVVLTIGTAPAAALVKARFQAASSSSTPSAAS